MQLSLKAKELLSQISSTSTKLGDIRKIANAIRTDHTLAMELWSTQLFFPRQLAILIMDKKCLSQEMINSLDSDMQQHSEEEKLQLID